MRHPAKPDHWPCGRCRARPPRAPGMVLCDVCRAIYDGLPGTRAPGWVLARGDTGSGWDTPP